MAVLSDDEPSSDCLLLGAGPLVPVLLRSLWLAARVAVLVSVELEVRPVIDWVNFPVNLRQLVAVAVVAGLQSEQLDWTHFISIL